MMTKAKIISPRQAAKMAVRNYRDYLDGWFTGLSDAQKAIAICRPLAFIEPLIDINLKAVPNLPNTGTDSPIRFAFAVEEVTNRTLIWAIETLRITLKQEMDDLASAPATLKTARTLPAFTHESGVDCVKKGYAEGINGAWNQTDTVYESLRLVDLAEEYKGGDNPLRNGQSPVDPRAARIHKFYDNLSYDIAVYSTLHGQKLADGLGRGLSVNRLQHEHSCWSTLFILQHEENDFNSYHAARGRYSALYTQTRQTDSTVPECPFRLEPAPEKLAIPDASTSSLALH